MEQVLLPKPLRNSRTKQRKRRGGSLHLGDEGECWGTLAEVLICAARMKEGKPSNWAEMYSGDPEIVREGERFLKEHPEMLPEFSQDWMKVVSWPPEALRYLGKDYQRKDRSRGTLRRAY